MPLHEEVTALMRGVAAEVVLPRFRALAAEDVAIKSAGEVVTIVDREAELRLHDGLAALGLGARILGEEAAEEDPALLDNVDEGLVWLIDPLDGTANFAAGRAPFGMMIALVENGSTVAGWMLDPLTGRLCHAVRGMGAICDGAVIRARPSGALRPRAALGTHFLAPDRRARVHAEADLQLDVVAVPRCAAESYPRLVLGQDDAALFQRILPWDHAAGALFVTEAGGMVTHWDGSPWRVGGHGVGVLAAASPRLWERAADALLRPAAGLVERDRLAA
ncbi:fructose-1,6-bisphosphatase/inositol monophosphatase family enzyme [Sphingomonas naasensis]|uniref:Inositol monophosphatase n=1 Tax=Sphingomonas naasensis TaxID=1344951 RepID=A0A4S1WBL0_9SPHN|nr:inositol monophosphatase [Sphingomonas naasensis]NIJ20022.1 fructose-1,6-bisphosphatase/inositol monophosphatase family enzyme [Sphingomonas naasensis]TGX37966.1 inositol monophosphatase [Sphingomonas naasensis]